MSESLVVMYSRLKTAHDLTVQRLQDILRQLDPLMAESDDLGDLLNTLEDQIVQRLMDSD